MTECRSVTMRRGLDDCRRRLEAGRPVGLSRGNCGVFLESPRALRSTRLFCGVRLWQGARTVPSIHCRPLVAHTGHARCFKRRYAGQLGFPPDLDLRRYAELTSDLEVAHSPSWPPRQTHSWAASAHQNVSQVDLSLSSPFSASSAHCRMPIWTSRCKSRHLDRRVDEVISGQMTSPDVSRVHNGLPKSRARVAISRHIKHVFADTRLIKLAVRSALRLWQAQHVGVAQCPAGELTVQPR